MNNKKSVFFHVTEQELRPSNSSYENIDSLNDHESESLESVILQDTCDYFVAEDVPVILGKVCSKIKKDGILYIQSLDLKQLCIAVTFDMVAQETIKKVIYPDKKSIHNMGDILQYLKDQNMKITVKRYINIFEYYIEAIKQ
tara:strand:- start:514 stop:939 length:426 start_codon:yes stop_codon:yes gene_type:complete